jgi:hypothetical protein
LPGYGAMSNALIAYVGPRSSEVLEKRCGGH